VTGHCGTRKKQEARSKHFESYRAADFLSFHLVGTDKKLIR
jgi:hypothetical protein